MIKYQKQGTVKLVCIAHDQLMKTGRITKKLCIHLYNRYRSPSFYDNEDPSKHDMDVMKVVVKALGYKLFREEGA